MQDDEWDTQRNGNLWHIEGIKGLINPINPYTIGIDRFKKKWFMIMIYDEWSFLTNDRFEQTSTVT